MAARSHTSAGCHANACTPCTVPQTIGLPLQWLQMTAIESIKSAHAASDAQLTCRTTAHWQMYTARSWGGPSLTPHRARARSINANASQRMRGHRHKLAQQSCLLHDQSSTQQKGSHAHTSKSPRMCLLALVSLQAMHRSLART